jgi:hypothetical protein
VVTMVMELRMKTRSAAGPLVTSLPEEKSGGGDIGKRGSSISPPQASK